MGCKENMVNLLNKHNLFQLLYVRNSRCVTAGPLSGVEVSNNRENRYLFPVCFTQVVFVSLALGIHLSQQEPSLPRFSIPPLIYKELEKAEAR